MLTRETLGLAYSVASKFQNTDMSIIPLDNSLFSDLNKTCSLNGLFINGKSLKDYSIDEVIGYVVSDYAVDKQGSGLVHDAIRADVKRKVFMGLSSLLNVVTNQAVPDARRVYTTAQDALNTVVNRPFEIIMVEEPPILKYPELTQFVEKHKNTPVKIIIRRGMDVLPEGSDVNELLTTGVRSFDDALNKSITPSKHISEARQYFKQINTELTNLSTLTLIVVRLLAGNLYDHPPEGIDLTLAEYNRIMAEVVAQSSSILYKRLVLRNARLGQMYVDAGKPLPAKTEVDVPKDVMVNGDAYRDALSKGVTPEAVMGNELLGRKYTAVFELVGNKDMLVEVYAREVRLREMRQTTLRNKNQIRCIVEAVTSILNERFTEAEGKIDYSYYSKRLMEWVGSRREKPTEPLSVMSLDAVCKVLYPDTDAETYLKLMGNLETKYPKVEPRELALMTTIWYYALWASKNLKQTKTV